jgi:transposase
MLAALLEGRQTPAQIAELAKGQLRKKQAELSRALEGVLQPHQRFMVVELLGHIDYLEEAIARLDVEVAEQTRPFEAELVRLDSIPGVNRRVAEVLAAEVGVDMKPFGDAEHLASWAGMCPGNKTIAGKRYSGKTRQGSPWLKRALVEAAHGAARKKNQYLKALYHRLAGRLGKKRATIAVGHSILKIAYYVLTKQQTYQDLGENYFDERDREAVKRRAVRRLEQLGYSVNLNPTQAAA